MTLLIAGGVIAWLTIGVGLSAFMARRGYDRTSWLVIGLLFGPVTLIFATVELASALPRPPLTVEGGRPGAGSVDVLTVFVDRDTALVSDVLNTIGDDTHRLVLAEVLPFDGAKAVETAASASLRDQASALARPWAELVLVFGAPATAIAAYAVQGRFGVVVTDRDVPGLRTSLRDTGIELRSGPMKAQASRAAERGTRRSARSAGSVVDVAARS
jgi:hypothetical protein